MEVNGEYKFKATKEQVWKILMDPQALQNAMPGCQRFEQVGENQYAITMKVGVGAIKGVYDGIISLTDIQAPDHYVLKVEGAGGQGFISGEGSFELAEVIERK